MEIIPAIDIIDGKCVRLTQGNYDQKQVYYKNPLDAAKQFEDAELTRLHLVDLAVADAADALRDGLQSRDHAQERGFSTARRPDQHAEGAVLDAERHPFHGFHVARINLPDSIERYACHCSFPLPAPAAPGSGPSFLEYLV